jgi:alkyl sulfatase BDS1-like metallo-beta-lactamase superfamily hydrolase
MHNLLPIRGAKVRDALQWSAYLQKVLEQAGDAQVLFNQHNWPVWGKAHIASFISRQRDLYQFMHDQTVRLINQGLQPAEIAEQIKLPPSLAAFWGGRGYYGDLRHNVKAIYQFYLGNYDGNPANLDPLPPKLKAQKYGGAGWRSQGAGARPCSGRAGRLSLGRGAAAATGVCRAGQRGGQRAAGPLP